MRSIFFSVLILLLSSCAIQQNRMWRDTEKMETPDMPEELEYRVAANDILQLTIQPNQGINLIDPNGISSNENSSFQVMSRNNQNLNQYIVNEEGEIKLPIFGYFKIGGYTLKEAEEVLEEKFKTVFTKPFVQIRVVSRRIIIFPGGGGQAKVLQLPTLSSSLMEAIALAGGINDFGKAKAVKIIRKVDDDYEIYKLDLRKIENLKLADIPLQSNDLVYIDSVNNYAGEIVKEISPFLSILSSAILIYGLLTGGF